MQGNAYAAVLRIEEEHSRCISRGWHSRQVGTREANAKVVRAETGEASMDMRCAIEAIALCGRWNLGLRVNMSEIALGMRYP